VNTFCFPSARPWPPLPPPSATPAPSPRMYTPQSSRKTHSNTPCQAAQMLRLDSQPRVYRRDAHAHALTAMHTRHAIHPDARAETLATLPCCALPSSTTHRRTQNAPPPPATNECPCTIPAAHHLQPSPLSPHLHRHHHRHRRGGATRSAHERQRAGLRTVRSCASDGAPVAQLPAARR